MPDYVLTARARQDLDLIFEFGLERFGQRQAQSYADRLLRRLDEIAHRPFRFPTFSDPALGYRMSTFEKHRIYYCLHGQRVEIVRILGRQDFSPDADR